MTLEEIRKEHDELVRSHNRRVREIIDDLFPNSVCMYNGNMGVLKLVTDIWHEFGEIKFFKLKKDGEPSAKPTYTYLLTVGDTTEEKLKSELLKIYEPVTIRKE